MKKVKCHNCEMQYIVTDDISICPKCEEPNDWKVNGLTDIDGDEVTFAEVEYNERNP